MELPDIPFNKAEYIETVSLTQNGCVKIPNIEPY